MLDRRKFVEAAAVFAAAGVGSRAAPASKPNVLFILAGGWRAQTLAATPNLDSMGRSGVVFDRLYTCYPRPAPARAALITGRFPYACGVPRDDSRLPLDQPSIAQQLKRAGYRTGYIGEWHLDGAEEPGFVPAGPRRHGFDYWAAFNRGHRYFDSIYFRDAPEPIRRGGFEPDYQTDLAIDFIKQSRQDPFFLLLAWGPPHPPLTPPPRTVTRTDATRIRLRDNVPPDLEKSMRDRYAGYDALCSALDQNLGRLLAALDERRLSEDTIVAFTSDAGSLLGSHGLDGDDEPFEECVRVPLVLRYPRALEPGRTYKQALSSVDLMATLVGMCGAEIPEAVQGQSLSSWITHGQGNRPMESVYSLGAVGTGEEWRMVVRGLDKLVVDRDLNISHLYNLGLDPFEMENLAHDSSQDLKRDELKAVLKDWMRRTGDGMDPSGLKKRG